MKTSETGHTQTYPYNYSEDSPSGHGESRTHDETLQHAAQAEDAGNAVCGVKGKSQFLSVPRFDIIRCVPPDYMHGVMLGIMKLLIDLWFDVTHRCSKWSIRSKVKDVDARLMSIRPPNVISRPPQSIQNIHTLRVHYAHAAANLNSGYSKYAKAARVHYFCTIALRTSRAVLTRA